MKRIIFFFLLFLFFAPALIGQSLEEAQYLYNNYRFEEAIEACKKYVNKQKRAQRPEAEALVYPLIDKATRANRMLTYCEDIQIIDSVVLDKESFLKAYVISSDAGYLSIENGTFYDTNQLKDKRYFADENNAGRSRIYSQLKLQGEWSAASLLDLPTDSLGDDRFPFIMADGVTLYYASTGHHSIGGYDLFISRYNSSTNSYYAPTQLGMPFNSPANDYLLVIDEVNNTGYFATDRFQEEGKVVIYTYIPNESTEHVDIDDEKELISRAKISAIHDSWRKRSYADHIRQLRDFISNEQKVPDYEFSFVINDNIVYHSLKDFDNASAKQLFVRTQEMEKNIEKLNKDLDGLREKYTKASNSSKQTMRSSILRKEVEIDELQEQYQTSLINVRNMEIRYLRQNN